MTTIAIRKKVHQYVDNIDTELLEAVYNMLRLYSDDSKESLLTKAQKSELDKTLAEHKAGKLTYHTIEQSRLLLYK